MTDQELHDYSADQLDYELGMLYETGARLVHDPAVHRDWVVKNALIESFTIHARSLAIFLYPEAHKRLDDDVTSDEYVKDVQQWRTARGSVPSELESTIRRTGKEIVHLTTLRHPPGAPQKQWSPEPIIRAFIRPLKVFVTHVPAGRLDVSVVQFVGSLPSPRAASVGPDSLSKGRPT